MALPTAEYVMFLRKTCCLSSLVCSLSVCVRVPAETFYVGHYGGFWWFLGVGFVQFMFSVCLDHGFFEASAFLLTVDRCALLLVRFFLCSLFLLVFLFPAPVLDSELVCVLFWILSWSVFWSARLLLFLFKFRK